MGNYEAQICYGDGTEKQSKLMSIDIPQISVKINDLIVSNPVLSELNGASLTASVGVGNGDFIGTISCAQYKNKKLVKVNTLLVKAEDEKAQITTTVGDVDSIKVLFWDTAAIKPIIGMYEIK